MVKLGRRQAKVHGLSVDFGRVFIELKSPLEWIFEFANKFETFLPTIRRRASCDVSAWRVCRRPYFVSMAHKRIFNIK